MGMWNGGAGAHLGRVGPPSMAGQGGHTFGSSDELLVGALGHNGREENHGPRSWVWLS